MSHRQIRTAQLIAPFGPGSIYTDRRGIPHVVCGLDFWYTRWDQVQGARQCDKPDEYERFEPRLLELLRVDQLRVPADYRHLRSGRTAPQNAGIHTPAHRFPTWYRHSKSGRLRRFNLQTQRLDNPGDGGRWLPVRFVAVCQAGHLCEFPWKQWVGCTCAGDGELYLTDFGGSELSSIRVTCRACSEPGNRSGRSLAGVTQRPDRDAGEPSAFGRAGIRCPGERPWLGIEAVESCTEPLVGALLNQTNLYFPRTASAIRLPDLTPRDDGVADLTNRISDDPSLAVAKLAWDMGRQEDAVDWIAGLVGKRGITAERAVIAAATRRILEPSAVADSGAPVPVVPESDLLRFRRAEFNVLRQKVEDLNIPDLRVVPGDVPPVLRTWLDRLHLVERLKETRAFYGFDRLEPAANSIAGMPDSAMKQLFREPPTTPGKRWLPAIEVFGEGLFFELRDDAIREWQDENEAWLKRRLDDGFVIRVADCYQTLAPAGADWRWASRYLLIHSLAHVLINRLVFECGYSTASLRERLYVSTDDAAPMAGILVYTAAGDSEGTLGGLVRLGRADRFEAVFQRAIMQASWCSADPVCSEKLGGQGSRLANLAACHACALLPETACETINHGLDRAMVVGTPDHREGGAFYHLLENVVVLQR